MNNSIVNNCISAFRKIDTAKDLKINKITYSDFQIIYDILKECVNSKKKGCDYTGETISENVAKWFMRRGANVKRHEVGWYISFK